MEDAASDDEGLGGTMPTKKREQSESGFYHVFQRGVNHFDIFEDDDDRSFFICKLMKYANDLGVEVHAWCLMSNHTHLLLKAEGGKLSVIMRQIGSVYARYFNARHGRSGPLFEGRFCSVCVETDSQLIAVVRYIHRNPIYHDERTLYGDYPWSSYGDYVCGVQRGRTASTGCVTRFVLSVIGSLSEFVRIHEEERDDERHIDIGSTGLMGDDEARLRANKILARNGFKADVSEIGALARELRNEALALVKSVVGCSIRQIQRLTAIAYSAIRDAINNFDGGVHPERFDSRIANRDSTLSAVSTRSNSESEGTHANSAVDAVSGARLLGAACGDLGSLTDEKHRSFGSGCSLQGGSAALTPA